VSIKDALRIFKGLWVVVVVYLPFYFASPYVVEFIGIDFGDTVDGFAKFVLAPIITAVIGAFVYVILGILWCIGDAVTKQK
jgi:hypothetical protein